MREALELEGGGVASEVYTIARYAPALRRDNVHIIHGTCG
jgi:hypothetical protein